MTTDDTMTAVLNMMVEGEVRRSKRAVRAWNTLHPYERRLVKEAAVMGYVLGERYGRISRNVTGTRQATEEPFPRDMQIVQDVIEHCDSTSDRYPYLADACAGRRRRITRKRLWPGETR